MKLGEFSGLSQDTVQLKCLESVPPKRSDWQIGDEVSLLDESGDLILVQGSQISNVCSEHYAALLRLKIGRGKTMWSLTSITKGQFYLRHVELPDAPTIIDLDLGVDNRIAEFLSGKREIAGEDTELATRWLTEEFFLEGRRAAKALCFYL